MQFSCRWNHLPCRLYFARGGRFVTQTLSPCVQRADAWVIVPPRCRHTTARRGDRPGRHAARRAAHGRPSVPHPNWWCHPMPPCSPWPHRCCSPASTAPWPPLGGCRSACSATASSPWSARPPARRPRPSVHCCCSGCSPHPPGQPNASPPGPTWCYFFLRRSCGGLGVGRPGGLASSTGGRPTRLG